MSMHTIRFQPSQIVVRVEEGSTVWDAARQVGLLLEMPCNGAGSCAKCRVKVLSGRSDPRDSEHRLAREELAQGWRLACKTLVVDSLEVEVQSVAPQKASHVILTDGDSVEVDEDEAPIGTFGVAFDLGTTTVAGSLYDLYVGE